MKCGCGLDVKSKLVGSDVHVKTREWNCDNCGLIKNQMIIDGEVMREWVKK